MLKRLLHYLHLLEDSILVLLLLSLVLLSSSQILFRNIGVGGMLWAESAGRILVLWLAMFGAMRASRMQNHIAIDLIHHYAKETLQKYTHFFVSMSCGLICAIAFYFSFSFILIEYEDNMMAYLNIPVWLCESIIPFALAVISLRFFINAFKVPNNRELDS